MNFNDRFHSRALWLIQACLVYFQANDYCKDRIFIIILFKIFILIIIIIIIIK
jgi:hypothetical protein